MVTNPAKVAAYPKIMSSLQETFGMENASIYDPFPDDQLFPDWIRSYGIGPISGPGGFVSENLARNEPPGYGIVNPGNPFQDFVAQMGGTGQPTDPGMGALEQISPALRYPFEAITERKITGAPIESQLGHFTESIIPPASAAQRITNIGTSQAEEGYFDREAFINWLSSARVRGTGPYKRQAEYEAFERMMKRGGG